MQKLIITATYLCKWSFIIIMITQFQIVPPLKYFSEIQLKSFKFGYLRLKSAGLLTLICLCFAFQVHGQVTQDTSFSHAITNNALELLGVPYETGTLDRQDHEALIWYHNRFDCVTFIEYVLAKSLAETRKANGNPLTFEDYLTKLRYRNGIINGYGSRLHYFTEWVHQLAQSGYGSNITKSIGGIPYNKKINYMTRNQDKYPKLSDTTAYNMVANAEYKLQNIPLYYIPKNNIPVTASKIQNGDIIAITTNISGLDIVHTGFAIWQRNQLHLLHASSDKGIVMISKEPLATYLAKHKSRSGIMVVRPEARINQTN